jgi:hypothetical protein
MDHNQDLYNTMGIGEKNIKAIVEDISILKLEGC